MPSNLLKIIVTDSSGVEHIFNEVPGEIENSLDLKDENGYVTIVTRTFEGGDKFDTETVTIFISPRRIDVLYGEYGE